MATFRCGIRGCFGAATAGAPVRGRADTGSSWDEVLSDLGTGASPSAGNLSEALVERACEDRAGGEAKLPRRLCHGPELFTTPLGVAAKLCTGAAEGDGLERAFCRRGCITVETVSACAFPCWSTCRNGRFGWGTCACGSTGRGAAGRCRRGPNGARSVRGVRRLPPENPNRTGVSARPTLKKGCHAPRPARSGVATFGLIRRLVKAG